MAATLKFPLLLSFYFINYPHKLYFFCRWYIFLTFTIANTIINPVTILPQLAPALLIPMQIPVIPVIIKNIPTVITNFLFIPPTIPFKEWLFFKCYWICTFRISTINILLKSIPLQQYVSYKPPVFKIHDVLCRYPDVLCIFSHILRLVAFQFYIWRYA